MGNKLQHLTQAINDGIRAASPAIASGNPAAGHANINFVRVEKKAVAHAATTDTDNVIPVGTVLRVKFDVTSGYDGGTVVTVGSVGTADALVAAADAVDMTTTGIKVVEMVTAWSTEEIARVTLAPDPAAGACNVCIEYLANT